MYIYTCIGWNCRVCRCKPGIPFGFATASFPSPLLLHGNNGEWIGEENPNLSGLGWEAAAAVAYIGDVAQVGGSSGWDALQPTWRASHTTAMVAGPSWRATCGGRAVEREKGE
jgi:hypothetical protein